MVDPCTNPGCRWHSCCSLRPAAVLPEVVVDQPAPAALVVVGDVDEGSVFTVRHDLPLPIGELHVRGRVSEENLNEALDEAEAEMGGLCGLLLTINTAGGESMVGKRIEALVLEAKHLVPVVCFVEYAASAGVLPALAATQTFAAKDGMIGGFGSLLPACDGTTPRLLVSRQTPRKLDGGAARSYAPRFFIRDGEHLARLQGVLDEANERDFQWVSRYVNGNTEALRLLMDGRVIGAREALAAGLVDGVLPHEGLARDILFSLAKNGRKYQTI